MIVQLILAILSAVSSVDDRCSHPSALDILAGREILSSKSCQELLDSRNSMRVGPKGDLSL